MAAKQAGGGESKGGAYPNPHGGKKPEGGPDSFMGHGGQTEIDYHGSGGEDEAGESNANSPAGAD